MKLVRPSFNGRTAIDAIVSSGTNRLLGPKYDINTESCFVKSHCV